MSLPLPMQAGYLLQQQAPVHSIEYPGGAGGRVDPSAAVCLVKAAHIADVLLGERADATRLGFIEQLRSACVRVSCATSAYLL
jgi:hypothetical protein